MRPPPRQCLRLLLRPLAALAAAALIAGPVAAEQITYFRIGTGSTGGTYFPIGGLIANVISNPPGSRPCEEGGSCGVPDLIAVAQSTQGSVANVDAIAARSLESGLSQADVAYWAYTGTGIYAEEGPVESLRAIANLYPESIHIVVRAEAGVGSVADLRGLRVSLGEEESGTLVDAEIILAAYGLTPADLDARYLKAGPAGDLLAAGELDALFFVVGHPAAAIAELAERAAVTLVPIAGAEAEAIVEAYPFFSPGAIPAGAYEGIGDTPTLAVGAQWVVSAEVDAGLVYGITRALWHESSRKLLDQGHEKAESIRPETALDGIGIPLHPGAERYYREAGLLGPGMADEVDGNDGAEEDDGSGN